MEENNSTFFMEDVYSQLANEAVSSGGVKLGEGRRNHLWKSYFEENFSSGHLIKEVYDNGTKYENLFKHKRPKKKGRSRAPVSGGLDLTVSRSRRRAAKLTVPSPDVKFETFTPLREMWTSYIDKLLSVSSLSKSNYMAAASKLMKADLHGCPLVVQKSKCPSYIGVSGIVIQETRNMFLLITRTDQIKRIPKSNSVFAVVLGKFVFSIQGNHFIVKPGERAAKKFKAKATVDL